MRYFILSQKKERGCPLGMLNAALYDKFYDQKILKEIKYGSFPWYANPSGGKPHISFPENLYLISGDKLYDFDIRSDSNFFYILSDNFLNLINKFNIPLIDCVPVHLCNRSGKQMSEKNYNIAILKKYDILDVAEKNESLFIFDEFKNVNKIEKLKIKSDFDQHLFAFSGLFGVCGSLFCSEVFYKSAIDSNVKGINFTPIDEVDWIALEAGFDWMVEDPILPI